MKKYIAVLLCLALTLTMLPSGVKAITYPEGVVGTLVTAQKAPAGIDVMAPVTEDSWGKPTISLNKDSDNTALRAYEDPNMEDLKMDLYFRWDSTKLYIAMVSPEEDVRGSDDSWIGDGIQLNIGAGTVIPGSPVGIYFTLAGDGVSIVAGGHEIDDKNITVVDDVMYVTLAIPFDDLGMVSADVKAGAPLAINLLRINGNATQPYAGWLAWGAFFGDDAANNPGNVGCNVIMLSDELAEVGTVIESDKALKAPSLDKVSKDTWGAPAIRVDKDSYNAGLRKHNTDTAEDTWSDIYTAWDNEYIYIGLVSPETDVRGDDDAWEGDGIQFKLGAGATMPGNALNLYFTFGADGASLTKGGGGIDDCLVGLNLIDGEMHAAIAVPFELLGMTAADIKAGAPLSFSILRISGTSSHEYAGWLAWGAFFGANAETNPGCTMNNVIVLSDDAAATGTTIESDKIFKAPSLDKVSKDTWGAPAIRVDKDSYNAGLRKHNTDTAEDTWSDIYTAWDNEYIYIGLVSPETDVRGDDDAWEGDGIQFKLGAGATMPGNALNLYFTFGADGASLTKGGGGIDDCLVGLNIIDGEMHAAIAVPFELLGMTAADIKAGAPLSFSILRISGTSSHEYAGWLAWGAFFGANAETNPGCTTDNVIVLSDNTADNATTIESDRILNAPSLDKVSKDTWGAPAIHVDKDSYNAGLRKHNTDTAEDTWSDIYTAWDNEYIYIGLVSPETDVRGDDDAWEGDGIQFKLGAGATMPGNALNLYFTFGADGASLTKGGGGIDDCLVGLNIIDGEMHAAIAVPFELLGMTAVDIKAGAPLSFSILRISGTASHEYAGWLAWGAFFGANAETNPGCTTDNLIVLADSNDIYGEEDTEDQIESLLTNVPQSSNGAMAEAGTIFKYGDASSHKLIKVGDALYSVYLTRSGISSMPDQSTQINEFTVQKIVDGQSTEVIYNYSYDGLQDVVKYGTNLYILGGHTTNTFGRFAKTASDERAVLNIWDLDTETETMNGYRLYADFENAADKYEYLTSFTSTANGALYIAYAGLADDVVKYVQVFEIDVETMSLSDSFSYELTLPESDVAENNFDCGAFYVTEDGIGFVFSDKLGQIYVNDPVYNETAYVYDGYLKDVVVDEDDNVYVLYENLNRDIVVAKLGIGTVSLGISGNDYDVQFAQTSNTIYVVAINKDGVAVLSVYVVDFVSNGDYTATLVGNTPLDAMVEYHSSLMAVVEDDGSDLNNDISIMFAGYRGIVLSWYTASVSTLS